MFFDRVIVRRARSRDHTSRRSSEPDTTVERSGTRSPAYVVRGRPPRRPSTTSAPASIGSASTASTFTFVAADFATRRRRRALLADAARRRRVDRLHLRRRRGVPRPTGARLAAPSRSGRSPRRDSRFAISLSMTPDTDEAAARQAWFRGASPRSASPSEIGSRPKRWPTSSSDTGWKDETTSPRAQRGTGGPVTLLTQPAKTPVLPSTSNTSPVWTCDPFAASY